MKDFRSPLQALAFLDETNEAACDALARSDTQAFRSAVSGLRDAGIHRTESGQAVIAYNNMFGASAPHNDFLANYAFSKIKGNDFFLASDTFRQMAFQFQDKKESCMMFMIGAKAFNHSREAIAESHSYVGDADAEGLPKKKGLSIDADAEKALKASQRHDKRVIKKLVDAQLAYLSAIDHLLYLTPMEYAVGGTVGGSPEGMPLMGLDNEFAFEEKAIHFVRPILDLARERRKYILTYQQDIDEVVGPDGCASLGDVLEQVNEYLKDPYIDVDRPFFYFDSVSVNQGMDDEKYSLQQYLMKTGGYRKNRFAFWSRGKHHTNEYSLWKRETALRTFLYLGIPARDMDAFFRLYGICFGTSTDAFTAVMADGERMLLPEAYIRNLIHFGLSYDIINYIIPKRNQNTND